MTADAPDRTLRERLEAGEVHLHGRLGLDYAVRPIRPEDAPSLMRGYDSLSEQGKWFRMLHAVPHLTPELAAMFCAPDPQTGLCVVIEGRPELAGLGGEILGGARIAEAGPGRSAEFAVSLRPEARGRGLAQGALEIVLAAAKEMGCASVYGIIARRNDAMIGLARKMGFRIEADPDDFTLVRAVIDAADIRPLPPDRFAG